MSELYDKLFEIIGDEEKTKSVQSSLGEFMLPKSEYAKVRDALKSRDEELEKIKLSSMDSEQKLQHELAKAQALQKDYGIKTNRLEAERLFVEAGLSIESYNDILEKSVSDDREKTLGLVNGFVSILAKEKDAVASKVKEDLVNSTKKPETGDNLNPTPVIKVKTTF